MKSARIHCVQCGHGWPINRQVSDFERQAIEANPCCKCGAYTLSFRERQTTRSVGRAANLPPFTPKPPLSN